MSETSPLPRHLTVLGEAMRPVWQTLTVELDAPVRLTAPVVDMFASVQHHLSLLTSTLGRLSEQTDDLMREVLAKQDASDLVVYRAVGRFEAPLLDILAGYHGVCALAARGTARDARDLLAGVYRHSLIEIRDWLGELVQTLEDPLAALKRRGLPTSGPVTLRLLLTLTAAPGLESLSRWAERHSPAWPCSPRKLETGLESHSPYPPLNRPSSPRKPETGLGFWCTLGALALGWGVGEALFGDDDCDT